MDINDQDIDILLVENNIQEFLDFISDDSFGNKKTLVNLLLFLFYSEFTKKIDWIKDIIFVIENNILNERYLAPCVKEYITNNKKVFENIKQTAVLMKNNGYIEYHNNFITYDMFNEYLHKLYIWCKETFDTI